MKKEKKAGFSLVEVVVLLLISTIILSAAGIGSAALISRSWETSAKGDLNKMADQMKADIVKHGFISLADLEDTDKRTDYFEHMGESFEVDLLDVSTLYYVNHELGAAMDAFYFGPDYDGVEVETTSKDPWGTHYRVYYLVSVVDESVCVVFASAGSDMIFADDSSSGYVGYSEGADIGDDILVFLNRPNHW